MKTIHKWGLLSVACLFLACNQTTPGQNTTDAGTQLSDKTVNSDMEDDRTASDVDTVTSPGSNIQDIKRNAAQEEKRKIDPNMAGQSDTHGADTKAGNK